jgi:fermentation-respiration switch protein FrsA (DUF1100 family)
MKQVVDGIRYDTEKAIAVARVSGNSGTPEWFSGTIYITPRSRRWFLAGDGGPYSPFGQSVGWGTYASGSGIAPLTPDRAREILEVGDSECQSALDVYAEELGIVNADDVKEPVAV